MTARQHHNKLRAFLTRTPRAVPYSTSHQRWAVHSAATLVLIIILAANILIWPIPLLGFGSDITTHQVDMVEVDSSAERAGLRVGDRLLTMYNRPWEDVLHSINFVDWIASREHPILVTVERNGQVVTLAIPQDPPSLSLQLAKLAEAGLALICWLTGYLLGVGRQQTALESQRVALFWLALGAVLGSATFALYAAFPILVFLIWLVVGVFIPFSVYMHLWFPPRFLRREAYKRATLLLYITCAFINISIATVFITTNVSLLELTDPLLLVLSGALVVGLGGSGWILQQDYRRTGVAQTRRQIRLIAVACTCVAVVWILGSILPTFVTDQNLLPSSVLHLVTGLVPLAYLVGAGTPDVLYRIDRVAIRLLIHAVSILVLSGLVLLLVLQLHLRSTAAVIALSACSILLYRPLQYGLQHLLGTSAVLDQNHHVLDLTIARLAETLDFVQLANFLREGVQETFGRPALALFVRDVDEPNTLTLWQQEGFTNVPSTITQGILVHTLQYVPSVVDSREVNQHLSTRLLTVDERCLVDHPSVVLWCSLRHTDGHVLGFLLLGMRGDLDPYRSADRNALQRLMNAAALAFAHSTEYTQRQEAEAVIRQLYHRLQSERDRMARDLAQGIHDDILNGTLRLNIEALRKFTTTKTTAELQQEIDFVLETMQALGSDLRNICEDLHPTGLDDPFGLPAVLRMQVQKMQTRWHGDCQFTETGTPQPIVAAVQREALRITKEALVNIEKHAQADRILVHLEYSIECNGRARLTISDDGCTNQIIAPRPGHLGVRQMTENAHAVGGTLKIDQQKHKGTTITFSFSTSATNDKQYD